MLYLTNVLKKAFPNCKHVESLATRFGSTQDKEKKKNILKNEADIDIKIEDPTEIWDLLEQLGSGAYGNIFKVVNKKTKFVAAAKIVEESEEFDLNLFLVEIEIMKKCNHKNVLDIYEAYTFENKLWIIIEYCSNGSLEDLINIIPRTLNENELEYIIGELVEALVYLHENCFVIHRDLKAANVLLNEKGEIKLADFGISAKNRHMNQKKTSFAGSPYWVSPEVIACENGKVKSYNFKIDIWSLGITCIELADKQPPNYDLSHEKLFKKIQNEEAPILMNPSEWSKEFNDFIKCCLKKAPSERPSASELLKHQFLKKSKRSNDVLSDLIETYKECKQYYLDNKEEDSSHTFKDLDSSGYFSSASQILLNFSEKPYRSFSIDGNFLVDQSPKTVVLRKNIQNKQNRSDKVKELITVFEGKNL